MPTIRPFFPSSSLAFTAGNLDARLPSVAPFPVASFSLVFQFSFCGIVAPDAFETLRALAVLADHQRLALIQVKNRSGFGWRMCTFTQIDEPIHGADHQRTADDVSDCHRNEIAE